MAASFYLSPFASFLQCLNDAGQVQPGLLIWTYAAGTSTPSATWTDITGTVPNSNPLQLNSAGRLNNVSVWQQGGVALKYIFSTNAGTVGSPVFGAQIGPPFDQVSGIDDPAATLATLANPASGSGADLVSNSMRSYDLIATVRAALVPALSAGETLIIDLEGSSTINDGGGGFFYWNASSTAADDGGISTIKPTAAGSAGRYVRLSIPAGVSGSFTATLLGVTGAPTMTINYVTSGGPALGLLTCSTQGQTGTSNSTSFSISGWPSGLRGVSTSVTTGILPAEDNTAIGVSCSLTIPPVSGNVVLSINNSSGNWTSSGTKGLLPCSFTVVLK
jgi:hypothetical protein